MENNAFLCVKVLIITCLAPGCFLLFFNGTSFLFSPNSISVTRHKCYKLNMVFPYLDLKIGWSRWGNKLCLPLSSGQYGSKWNT